MIDKNHIYYLNKYHLIKTDIQNRFLFFCEKEEIPLWILQKYIRWILNKNNQFLLQKGYLLLFQQFQ